MRKVFLIFGFFGLFISAKAQVGINTETPAATIEVTATKTDGTTAEGIIAPRLTRAQAISKDTKYTALQTATIIYVTDLSGTLTAKTTKITQIGYYYFDGTLWQPFTAAAIAASNPWYKVGTSVPSTLNTDNSYLTAQAVIGGNTPASINGGTANSQLTVAGGDASVNGVTVGKGGSNITSNTVVGYSSLKGNTTGASNSSLGYFALATNTIGSGNSAFGDRALIVNTTGDGNTAIGNKALAANTTGGYNTALGSLAGSLITTGSNNIAIGYNVAVPSNSSDNQMNIGNTLYGVTSTTPAAGRVSIGKTAPDAGVSLDVKGLTQVTGSNNFRYVDGNQAAGSLLTSDATGNASWTKPNVLQSPLTPPATGTSYSGVIKTGIDSGIKITLPANSTWIVSITQLINFKRLLKTYTSGSTFYTEGIWLRMHWSDTATGGVTADQRAGKYISVACYAGSSFHSLQGSTVIRNSSTSSKTYYFTTGLFDPYTLDASDPLLYNALFADWAENSLVAIPASN